MLRDKEGKENDGRPPRRDLCRLQIGDAILGNKGWEGVEGGRKREKKSPWDAGVETRTLPEKEGEVPGRVRVR